MARIQLRSQNHFFRRTLVLGITFFVISVLLGVGTIFWREYYTNTPASVVKQLLIQATIGPIFMAVYFLWPITFPVMFILALIILIGSLLRRLWISALAFALLGMYWLWMVHLILSGAFD